MIYLIYIGILSIGENKGSPFLHKDLAVFYPVSTFTCAKSHSQWYKSDRQTVKKKNATEIRQESRTVDDHTHGFLFLIALK